MHGPPRGVHPLCGLVGRWPAPENPRMTQRVVRAEPSLDLLEHVGCEAVDRAVRRIRAVHAAQLDDRNRLVATERVGEEAVLEGVPRRHRAVRTAAAGCRRRSAPRRLSDRGRAPAPSIRSMPATVRASRSRGGSKSPKPASASAAPSSSAPRESRPASKRSSSGPTSSTPDDAAHFGETPPLELGRERARRRRPPPHDRLVLEGPAVELHALGSRQLVVTHQDRGHELGWQSFPQLGIDALGRECVVDDLHVGDDADRVVRGAVQRSPRRRRFRRCSAAPASTRLGATNAPLTFTISSARPRWWYMPASSTRTTSALLHHRVPSSSVKYRLRGELGIAQISERTRPRDQQLGRRGVVVERLQPNLHAGFQAAEGDATLADRVVGSDVEMCDRADLGRGIPGSNREVRPDEPTQRRDERPVRRFRVRPEERHRGQTWSTVGDSDDCVRQRRSEPDRVDLVRVEPIEEVVDRHRGRIGDARWCARRTAGRPHGA